MSDVLRRWKEPQQTKTLRTRYAGKLYNRFRDIKGLIRESVAANDALRLKTPRGQIASRLASPVDDFQAEQNAEKKEAFMRWFRNAVREGVLETLPDGRVRRGEHWTAKYVRAAQQKGTDMADGELKRFASRPGVDVVGPEGVGRVGAIRKSWNMPINPDTLELLYTRHYEALEGITAAVDREVSRVLTDGFVEGIGPREMAGRLNGRVDAIGITRARTMARTETIRTANVAATDRYEQAGVNKVRILVADDDRTCDICNPKDGDILTLEESRGPEGPIYHPNCRCTTAPALET